MIPNAYFELDNRPHRDMDMDDNYATVEWWEVHLDRYIHCITIDLLPEQGDRLTFDATLTRSAFDARLTRPAFERNESIHASVNR